MNCNFTNAGTVRIASFQTPFVSRGVSKDFPAFEVYGGIWRESEAARVMDLCATATRTLDHEAMLRIRTLLEPLLLAVFCAVHTEKVEGRS